VSGVKNSWAEVVFELAHAREAHTKAWAEIEDLMRQKTYTARKFQALRKKEIKCAARVHDLASIEINLRRIAGVKVLSKPTGRKGGDA
jgi:hypothetical protein